MGKTFARRVSKKERKTIDLTDRLDRDLFEIARTKLYEGAILNEVELKKIKVKDQVRTKFNDSSIKELAKNIKANGLIQPLVLHRDRDGVMTLICGERRFRAMSSINTEKAPCFILEDKTQEELMAIQFSENQSREALHYIDKADGIHSYQQATKASERKIQAALGISKTEVHRSLLIAKVPSDVKEAAKKFNIEKYVLLEWDALGESEFKKTLKTKIVSGEITKRAQLKREIKNVSEPASKSKTKTRRPPALPKDMTANAFLKIMKASSKSLDPSAQKLLKELVEQTKDMMN